MLDYRAHTFLAVVRAGSFTRAAEELHVTQPAVSQHIRQLEAHYGCTLFSKTGRGVEPTDAGRLLYQALDAERNDEARLRAELDSLRGEKDARPAPAPRLHENHRGTTWRRGCWLAISCGTRASTSSCARATRPSWLRS